MAQGPELRIVQPHVRIGDAHVCSDDRQRLSLLRAIYEPLVRRAPSGGHRPTLAEGWEVTPDARVWTFRLRNGAVFHDGRPLSADDVAASLRRIRDDPPEGELGTSGVYQSYLEGSTIEPERADTVTLRLPRPMADLLDILVELVVLPADALSRSHALPPGSGPFRLVERGDDEVLLERHAPS
jgi:peptide/nickel transport system substrate-binding protein